MHVYFSGIGGTAIGPLAMIAKQAGYAVSGSDKQQSQYIDYLKKHGLEQIHIGQTTDAIKAIHDKHPIDWLVYSSAVSIEDSEHPELKFAQDNNIRCSKRDDFLNQILTDHHKKLIAIAGTHGKTTTTAMMIWACKQLEIPISYSVGAKIPFGEMGQFKPESEYFIYECDEFDRNFLAFHPFMSLITGIDYDHHEIFPTRDDYQSAFRKFLDQSTHNLIWRKDAEHAKLAEKPNDTIISDDDDILNMLSIPGLVNRKDAAIVIHALHELTGIHPIDLVKVLNQFPGLSRRFEMIKPGLYSDYAHTIPKVRGCLQLASELSDQVVVIHEPLTNRRQHYIQSDYKDVFLGVKHLYWVPSYLAREEPSQTVLTPEELIENLSNKEIVEPAELNEKLKQAITNHLQAGDLVVCLSGGGGGSLDEWLRENFS